MNAIRAFRADSLSSTSLSSGGTSAQTPKWQERLETLAQKLNATSDVLQKDIQAARQQSKSSAGTSFVSALAQQLGIDATQLQSAMQQAGMQGGGAQGVQGGHHHRHGGGVNMDAVAQQLGVQTDDMKSAFQAAIQEMQQDSSSSSTTADQRKSQMLAAVAKKLNVDPTALQAAVDKNSMKIVNTYC